jgi:colanic acid biosynthesis glycosyl transferase WcaI
VKIHLLNLYYAPDEAATAQMLADVGAALTAAGHEVTAICSNRSYGDAKRRYPRRDVIDGVRVDRVQGTGFGRESVVGRISDYLTFVAGAVRRLMFGRRPDLVIALTTPPMIASLAVLIARLRRFRVAFWSMDVYPDVAFALGAIRSDSLVGRMLKTTAGATVRRADVVVALGETMATKLRAAGARKVEVIHNWADSMPLSDGRPSSWKDRFVVLYSGNLGLAHEFETVLAAAKRLTEADPRVLFAFVGVGPRLAEVQAAARELPNVEFRSYVERARLGETLTAADVHLVTLRPNMSGLLVPSKIYGILAAGRPTVYVGPAAGEVFDIVTEGGCGTVVPNSDVDRLVATISEYARDDARRQREGENARRLFERRFTKRIGTEAFSKLAVSIL